ncbi:MAG: winged helix-turn-helix domain-containing protein [Burkholderiales bacterium]|nr:winged helix-turn-helix domain-containing protein [Burkholderiales bacterium]
MQIEPDPSLKLPQRLAWPGFVLDRARGELLDAQGRPSGLRAQALKLLLVLGEQAGQVVSKDELMRRVWGGVVVTEDSLVQAVGDIRRVLNDPRHERVRTVPRRGYLLAVDATAASPAGALQPVERSQPWSWPAALGAALLLLAIGVVAWAVLARPGSPPPRSLAILPFESEGGTEDWFVNGVSADLTALVGAWPDLRLIGRGTMARYQGRNADPRAVARELGVRHVLTGRARRDGDRVRLAVSLIDGRGGQVLWSELRDVPRAGLGPLIGDVAGGIARAMLVAYGDAVAADVRALAPDQAEADDLAMQGMAELLRGVSREHFELARQLFERAVQLDPDSRRGLAGVSLANSNLALWEWAADRPAAIARAEHALARLDLLAPELLMARLAHASLANLRGDWAGLLAIGDALVEHFPNEPASHHHRCSALLRLGRFDDAIAACERAMRISPRDSRVATWQGLIGFNQFQLGRHAAAEESLRASVLANPRVPFYAVVLAAALAEQGRRDEALRVIGETAARHPAYRQSSIANYWVASDARFLAGRERIAALAGELGLPP